jgi:hypothetical protein
MIPRYDYDYGGMDEDRTGEYVRVADLIPLIRDLAEANYGIKILVDLNELFALLPKEME